MALSLLVGTFSKKYKETAGASRLFLLDNWGMPMSSPDTIRLPPVLEDLPVAVLLFDSEGRLFDTNPAGCKLLPSATLPDAGVPLDELTQSVPVQALNAVRSLLSVEANAQDGEVWIAGAKWRYAARRSQDRDGDVYLALLPPATDDDDFGFLSTAAHELKTPLTAIKGGTQLLERRMKRAGPAFGERDLQLLAMVSEQVTKLAAMVDDLLDTSRLAGGRIRLALERLNLREVVDQAISEYERDSDRTISRSLDEPSVYVKGDPKRLRQLLRVLLVNAASYSPPEAPIIVSVSSDSSHAQLSVRDYGVGVDVEERARVFGRFFRGRREHQGLGVGLYIASELVNLHGGSIELRSEPPEGSTFEVLLPLDQEPRDT